MDKYNLDRGFSKHKKHYRSYSYSIDSTNITVKPISKTKVEKSDFNAKPEGNKWVVLIRFLYTCPNGCLTENVS